MPASWSVRTSRSTPRPSSSYGAFGVRGFVAAVVHDEADVGMGRRRGADVDGRGVLASAAETLVHRDDLHAGLAHTIQERLADLRDAADRGRRGTTATARACTPSRPRSDTARTSAFIASSCASRLPSAGSAWPCIRMRPSPHRRSAVRRASSIRAVESGPLLSDAGIALTTAKRVSERRNTSSR